MPQLSLFDVSELVLVADERGRIVYTPGFVDAEASRAWFLELRERVDWRAERRMMYDREVDVPRLVGHYRLDQSADAEGDPERVALPPNALPRAIREAARLVAERLHVPFNSVGLNLYRDGRDSVAPHNDHLNELCKGFPIALVSLGAMRRMTIRAKAEPRRLIHVDLEPGSLFVMDYATQIHYTHAVPKTSDVVGERISLAFRVKRERVTPMEGSASGFYR
jgi:alkylated DNA repair dioxygenase AlkB